MKRTARLVVLLLLAGGWSLAGSAVHVVRSPGRLVLFPKDRLGFHDTYVDTRHWTLTDVRAHPAVVARLLHLNHTDLLAHTVDPTQGDPATQLTEAIAHPAPTPALSTHPMLQRVTDRLHAASTALCSFFN